MGKFHTNLMYSLKSLLISPDTRFRAVLSFNLPCFYLTLSIPASLPSSFFLQCFPLCFQSLSVSLSYHIILSPCVTASQPQLCPRTADREKHRDLTQSKLCKLLFSTTFTPFCPALQLPALRHVYVCVFVCACVWLSVCICLWRLHQQWMPMGICCQIIFDSVGFDTIYSSH